LNDLHDGYVYLYSQEAEMQVAKWGNSLAVRLPVDLVRKLGLQEGDQIDLIADDGTLKVRPKPRAEEVLEKLRHLRGKLPAAERLSRDAAHER
jgi:antitoxin MazE